MHSPTQSSLTALPSRTAPHGSDVVGRRRFRSASTAGHVPTCHVLWHDRRCTTMCSTVQLRVPLVGRASPDLAARLAVYLDALWTGRTSGDGVTVTSVAATIGHTSDRDALILVISLDRLPDHRRVDDARMGRELQHAIERCSSEMS